MSISSMVEAYVRKGFSRPVAQNLVAEEIILRLIAESPLAEHVTLKGGIVMYNLTKNARRATRDIDFDFIRYSIGHESIHLFFDQLNRRQNEIHLKVEGAMKDLHQQDYEGVRVNVRIEDASGSLKLKLDIGVHKYAAIEQRSLLFVFDGQDPLALTVNSPEQIFAEKCISLGRLGPVSTRYKDVYDLCYLTQFGIDAKQVRFILSAFLQNSTRPPHSLEEVKTTIRKALEDPHFAREAANPKNRWLDVDYDEAAKAILAFLKRV